MRLFIAIDVPENVKQSLLDLQQPEMALNWTSAETLHLTLRFVGEVGESTAEKLSSELSGLNHTSFTMAIRGLGYFPPRKFPRVVWAGIEENRALKQLYGDIEAACRQIGLEPDDRPFKPHITIGRVKGASEEEVLSFIDRHSQFEMEGIPVDEFILYESKLHPDGAVHEVLQRFSLTKGNGR